MAEARDRLDVALSELSANVDWATGEIGRLRAVNAELVVALEVAYENMRLVNTNAVTGAKLQRFIDATLKVRAAIQLSKAGAK